MTCKTPPQFPRHPQHDQEICDASGNIYKYSAISNRWILLGRPLIDTIVTEHNDGIITPDIYNRLRYLEEVNEDITHTLKLAPGDRAYWYYFRSPDKLFRFNVEGDSTLRIEVDAGRLYQMFRRLSCKGAKGPIGDCGIIGTRGTTGPAENFYQPVIDDKFLKFAIKVPSPLTTDLSLRLFKLDLNYTVAKPPSFQANTGFQPSPTVTVATSCSDHCTYDLSNPDAEIYVSLSPTTPPRLVLDRFEVIDMETTEIHYDPVTTILYGTIGRKTGVWDSTWLIKARQRGPTGERGRDAPTFFCLDNCETQDPLVTVNCPLVSFRLDCNKQIIYPLRQCLGDVCTGKIRFVNGSPTLTGPVRDGSTLSGLLAAERITADCKRVQTFSHVLTVDETPELELADWTPLPGCLTHRYGEDQGFDWIPDTDTATPPWDKLPSKDEIDEVIDGTIVPSLSSKYPLHIELQTPPDEDPCCQDDLFYCGDYDGSDCVSVDTQAAPKPQMASPICSDVVMLNSFAPRQINRPVVLQRQQLSTVSTQAGIPRYLIGNTFQYVDKGSQFGQFYGWEDVSDNAFSNILTDFNWQGPLLTDIKSKPRIEVTSQATVRSVINRLEWCDYDVRQALLLCALRPRPLVKNPSNQLLLRYRDNIGCDLGADVEDVLLGSLNRNPITIPYHIIVLGSQNLKLNFTNYNIFGDPDPLNIVSDIEFLEVKSTYRRTTTGQVSDEYLLSGPFREWAVDISAMMFCALSYA